MYFVSQAVVVGIRAAVLAVQAVAVLAVSLSKLFTLTQTQL